MNIPNILTLLRIALIPVFVLLYYLPNSWSYLAATSVFALAVATDWLDGYLARRLGETSAFGAFLDPVADQLMVATALVLIVDTNPSGLSGIWIALPSESWGRSTKSFILHQPANRWRRTELWLATCFEFFLALPGQPHYWEFNLSPSGDWNAFRMDAYRRIRFREEEAISNLPVQFRVGPDCMAIGTALSLDGLIDPESTLQAGITSVIQTQDGHETYWALVHPQPQADFHLRESFILEMEGAGPL